MIAATRTSLQLLLTAILPLLLATPAVGEPASQPQIPSRLRERLLVDSADGVLDQFSLLSSALVFSGAEEANQVQSYEDQVAFFCKQLARQSEPEASCEVVAQIILEFLHDQLLTGNYDPGCSDLRRAFDDGDYNCVTATILFKTLAERCHLQVEAVSLPGHVRCQVRTATNTTFVVETTSDHWPSASIGTDREGTPRVLTDLELVAKLIYNRGLCQLSQRNFAEALDATELSWHMDPDHQAARDNVAAVINNWSIHLCAAGQYERAIRLLQEGQIKVPEHALLAANERHVYLCWIQALTQSSRLKRADQVRASAIDRFPNPADWPNRALYGLSSPESRL